MFDIKVNKPTNEISYFIGPIIFRPVYFNPTRSEVNEFFNTTKNTDEINYIQVDENGIKTVTCTVLGYFKDDTGNEFKGYFPSIFVSENQLESNKTGVVKYQFIDSFGSTQWVDKLENCTSKYFYKNQARRSYQNESILMQFFLKLANLNTYYSEDSQYGINPNFEKGDTFLDMESLFKGDFSKYRELITNMCTENSKFDINSPLRNRKIGVLASIKDDGISVKQVYYNQMFIRVKPQDILDSYDVKRVLADINIYDANGVLKKYIWSHTAQDINEKLVKYIPNNNTQRVGVEKETSTETVESNNPFMEKDSDFSL
jgi:hypothetical protein